MEWKGKNDFDADPFNLDRNTARGVICVDTLKRHPFLSNLDWKWFRYTSVDKATLYYISLLYYSTVIIYKSYT